MASIYDNPKKHLVIEMTKKEATSLHFGLKTDTDDNIMICGTCNSIIDDKIYYVAGIHEILCKDCIDDYCKNMNHYTDKDSITYEIRHFNYVAEKLKMNERALIFDGKITIISK